MWPWLVGGLLLAAGLVALAWRPLRRLAREAETRQARLLFERQREALRQRFFDAAAATGKPRGLRWKSCDWDGEAAFARDRQSGRLTALAGVTVQFEAVAGSDMEGHDQVDRLRSATAVFVFERGRWHAAGRAVFNLGPAEVVARYPKQFERLDDAPAPSL
jgi:hypothetical protein